MQNVFLILVKHFDLKEFILILYINKKNPPSPPTPPIPPVPFGFPIACSRFPLLFPHIVVDVSYWVRGLIKQLRN